MDSGDWRTWVWRYLGLPVPSRIPIAAIARQTESTASALPGQWWLAQCVHLEAGVDRVYLAAESPALSGEEWRELERGFNAAFGAAGFRMVDGRDAQAHLLSTTALESDTIDPARVRGGDILQALPSGPDAAMLKRLMTEIQMWLHDHPVNIARQDLGAGAVNGLWIWGGGEWPLKPPAVTLPALRSDERFLNGLWRFAGDVGERVPQSFRRIDLAGDDAMIVALSTAPAAGARPALALMDLEGDWFQPAFAALQRGQIARLQMHVNDRLFSLTRRNSWRWWRRRRPWIEMLT